MHYEQVLVVVDNWYGCWHAVQLDAEVQVKQLVPQEMQVEIDPVVDM